MDPDPYPWGPYPRTRQVHCTRCPTLSPTFSDIPFPSHSASIELTPFKIVWQPAFHCILLPLPLNNHHWHLSWKLYHLLIRPQNYHRAYTDIVRTLTEYHGQISESVQSWNHSESLAGEVPSWSCSIIKEISVLCFPFKALLLLCSCPSLVVLKGQVLCSYSPVCNQLRFPFEYYSPLSLPLN